MPDKLIAQGGQQHVADRLGVIGISFAFSYVVEALLVLIRPIWRLFWNTFVWVGGVLALASTALMFAYPRARKVRRLRTVASSA